MTLLRNIEARLQKEPERRLATFRTVAGPRPTDQSYSYADAWSAAAAFAEALDGVPAGGHVMLVMPLGFRLIAAHLGVQLQGLAVSIFTHPSEKIASDVYSRNLQHAINHLEPAAIITVRQFAPTVVECWRDRHSVVVIAEDIASTSSYQTQRWKGVSSGDPVIIQHSSGSTGLQKSVVLNHDMVAEQCDSYARFIGLDPAVDRVCSWLPLYHDMGLFTAWLMPVLEGIPVAMVDPFEWVRQPLSLLELIGDVRGTLCWQPNFAFKLLAGRAGHGGATIDLSSMRGFTNCSEPVSSDAMAQFYGAFARAGLKRSAMWTCYAMAENSFAVTASGGPMQAPREITVDVKRLSEGIIAAANEGQALVSCGKPIDGTEIRVVNDQRQPVQTPGAIGEIAIRSNYLMRGYYRAEEVTAAAIDADGWYYSGDLGGVVEGCLYVTGRKKDLLIVAGRNFYPQDIEEICYTCDGVIPGRAVALGVDDAALGTQKIIVIVESHLTDREQTSRLSDQIRQHVLEQLDCPVANVRIVPHMWLLKTSSGKIARKPNLDKHLSEPVKEQAVLQPTLPVERRASLLEVGAWSFVTAFAIYMYILIFLLGDNKSWNIYAGF
ncbi:MAG: AMP-binding protein [Xanthobacteraceae bacterium]